MCRTDRDSGTQPFVRMVRGHEVEARNRAGNQLGLWVLLGPAGVYAAIAMVNATLIGASQRRHQDAVLRLLGATPRQVRRMAVWEAGFIGAAGLTAGSLVSGFTAWLVRRTIINDVSDTAMTVPWVPLLATGATCIALVVAAALAGTRVHVIAARATPERDSRAVEMGLPAVAFTEHPDLLHGVYRAEQSVRMWSGCAAAGRGRARD